MWMPARRAMAASRVDLPDPYEQGHWPIDGYGLGLLEERQVKWIRLARGEAIVNDGQARQMHRHSF